MNLDIDPLILEELHALNERVVDRIKHLQDLQSQLDLMAFNPGARVSFDSRYGRQTGVVAKLNRTGRRRAAMEGLSCNGFPVVVREDVPPGPRYVAACGYGCMRGAGAARR